MSPSEYAEAMNPHPYKHPPNAFMPGRLPWFRRMLLSTTSHEANASMRNAIARDEAMREIAKARLEAANIANAIKELP